MRKEYADRGYVMHSSADSVIWKKLTSKPEVLHAEANAIAKLAQSNESSKDAELFCTYLPCLECAKLIHQAGIKKVYYREDIDTSKGSGREFLENSKIHNKNKFLNYGHHQILNLRSLQLEQSKL